MPPTTLRLQRVQELQADLAIKRRELETLQAEERELKGGRGEQMSLVDRCVKDRRAVLALPIEQVGNTTAQFRAVRTEEAAAAAILRKSVKELRLQAAQGDKDILALKRQVEAIRRRTGHSDDPRSMYQQALNARQDRFATDPAAVLEIENKVKQVRAEMHAATVICAKKSSVLAELATALDQRRGVALKADTVQAARLVAERDLRERKLRLRALLQQHAQLDVELQAELAERDHTTRALMEHNVKNVADMTSNVTVQHREEERLLKAQAFRLRQLADRMATVETAMGRHSLKSEVEAISAEALQAAEEDAPGAAEASASDEALGPFLDADTVVPADETVPMAVYALFHADREKHRRNLRRQEIMLLEKAETKNAILDKVRGLMEEYEARDDELYEQKLAQEEDIDGRADDAMVELEARRDDFNAVVLENRALSEHIAALRDAVHGGAAPHPRWNASARIVVDPRHELEVGHCIACDITAPGQRTPRPKPKPAPRPRAAPAPAAAAQPSTGDAARDDAGRGSTRATPPPPPVPPLQGVGKRSSRDGAAKDDVQSGW